MRMGMSLYWLLVKSFRFVKAEPGVVYCKYNYSEDYKRIFAYGRGRPSTVHGLKPADADKHSISEQKKKDLLKLCTKLAIPEEFHGWYNSLQSSKRATDHLLEPAAGEDDDEY